MSTNNFFLLANLSPKDTGLPFVIWISVKGGARHDVRVKVSLHTKVPPKKLISVAIRPKVRVVKGTMSPEHLAALTEWIDLNRGMLLRYWEADIDTVEAVSMIRKVE